VELFPRLRGLLENFNHVIVQVPGGGVDRVIVLGEKVPFEPPPATTSRAPSRSEIGEGGDIVVESERRGAQHLVPVTLGGTGGSKVERELQLDTGADYLVLPLSLLADLGIDRQALEEREMQTANGKVKAHIGTLPSLWLGESRIRDVETAFLEDNKLGGGGLLGMSVLRRYKLTIDDEKNSITLGPKEGSDPIEAVSAEETGAVGPGDKNP
jgi:clan AA aspartic protease (TIGR02281 family)